MIMKSKTCVRCGRVFGNIGNLCWVCENLPEDSDDPYLTPKTDGPDTTWPENPTEDELDLGRKF